MADKEMSIQEIYDYAKLSVLAYVDLSEHANAKPWCTAPQTIIDVSASTDPPGHSARLPEALGSQMFDL